METDIVSNRSLKSVECDFIESEARPVFADGKIVVVVVVVLEMILAADDEEIAAPPKTCNMKVAQVRKAVYPRDTEIATTIDSINIRSKGANF